MKKNCMMQSRRGLGRWRGLESMMFSSRFTIWCIAMKLWMKFLAANVLWLLLRNLSIPQTWRIKRRMATSELPRLWTITQNLMQIQSHFVLSCASSSNTLNANAIVDNTVMLALLMVHICHVIYISSPCGQSKLWVYETTTKYPVY